MSKEITGWEDVIDSRDVVARVDELTEEREAFYEDHEDRTWSSVDPAAAQELKDLEELLSQLMDVGGDTPEDGQTLVRENYFSAYIREMIKECTDPELVHLFDELPWSCIDWAAAAEEYRVDYTEVTFRDVPYYVR